MLFLALHIVFESAELFVERLRILRFREFVAKARDFVIHNNVVILRHAEHHVRLYRQKRLLHYRLLLYGGRSHVALKLRQFVEHLI